MIRAICLIVISIFLTRSACAQENFRVPRPAATAGTSASANALENAPGSGSTFVARPASDTSESLLGDVIYAGMRTPVPRTSFERWRQIYCAPFICNMVLCHGTCGDFAEHCPSFAESGRVIHLDMRGCMMPSGATAESVSKGNHCSAKSN